MLLGNESPTSPAAAAKTLQAPAELGPARHLSRFMAASLGEMLTWDTRCRFHGLDQGEMVSWLKTNSFANCITGKGLPLGMIVRFELSIGRIFFPH